MADKFVVTIDDIELHADATDAPLFLFEKLCERVPEIAGSGSKGKRIFLNYMAAKVNDLFHLGFEFPQNEPNKVGYVILSLLEQFFGDLTETGWVINAEPVATQNGKRIFVYQQTTTATVTEENSTTPGKHRIANYPAGREERDGQPDTNKLETSLVGSRHDGSRQNNLRILPDRQVSQPLPGTVIPFRRENKP